MTDPLLNYQTPAPAASTGLRTATWIFLLVLGILYALGGLCAGGSLALVSTLLKRRPAGAPAGLTTIYLVTGIVLLVISMGICATFIWAALRLRRGSRAAAITALVMSILGTTGFLAIVGLGIAVVLNDRTHPASAVYGIVFYLLPAAANAAATILLIVLRRQERRAAYSVTMS